jgi:GH25 family lysozyme M1 (1,4-beta-N-acetylmuramidase)
VKPTRKHFLRRGKWLITSACVSLSTLVCLTVITPESSAQTQTQVHASIDLPLAAPGGYIHGADISLWQHKAGKINFAAMYNSGIRFLIDKGSDSTAKFDSTAFVYARADRKAAHLAGIYTSFYHYETLPNITDITALNSDAVAQAQHVAQRVVQLGAPSTFDLPPALDLESNCVAADSYGNCTKRLSPALVTQWVSTFMTTLSSLINRKAMLYSYPTFIEGNLLYSSGLSNYPLWVASYGASPADSSHQPGSKNFGCYLTPWTNANCTQNWSVWQYTSCGIGNKYGVSSERIDLNVFNGGIDQFLAMTSGNWNPQPLATIPINQSVWLNVETTTATDSAHSAWVTVKAIDSHGAPLLSGLFKFYNPNSLQPPVKIAYSRNTAGEFVISLGNLVAGNYIGSLQYVDTSGVYQNANTPVAFTVTQAPPTIGQKVPQKTAPAPAACAGQFIN